MIGILLTLMLTASPSEGIDLRLGGGGGKPASYTISNWLSQYVAFTRNDTQLCCQDNNGPCASVAPNVPCITASGIYLPNAGSNVITWSADLTGSGWSSDGGVTATNTTVAWPVASGGNWYAIANTSARARHYASPTGASTGPATVEAWFRAESGSAVGMISLSYASGPVTACTCGRSDGGACTADRTTDTTRCQAYATFSNAPVRMWAVATTGISQGAYPGISGGDVTNTGTIWAASVQAHLGGSPLPYYATAGTPYSGPGPVAVITSRISSPTWIRGVEFTPSAQWANYSAYRPLFMQGPMDSANSTALYLNGAQFQLFVYGPPGGGSRFLGCNHGLGNTAGAHKIIVSVGTYTTRPIIYLDGVAIPGCSYSNSATSDQNAWGQVRVGYATPYNPDGYVLRYRECKTVAGCMP
jgi:hypothetical protein